MDKTKTKLRGFTLLELVIVIAILAVLAGVLIPSVVDYIRFNKIQGANEQAQNIFTAAQNYLTDQQLKGVKPDDLRNDSSKKLTMVCGYTGIDRNTGEKYTNMYLTSGGTLKADYNINASKLYVANVNGVNKERCTIADGIVSQMADLKGAWAVAFYPDTFTVAYAVYCDENANASRSLDGVYAVAYGGNTDAQRVTKLFTGMYATSGDLHSANPTTQEGCAKRGNVRQYVGQYPIPFAP